MSSFPNTFLTSVTLEIYNKKNPDKSSSHSGPILARPSKGHGRNLLSPNKHQKDTDKLL